MSLSLLYTPTWIAIGFLRLSQERPSSIIDEKFPLPDIPLKHRIRGVAGLLPDFP